MQRTQRRSQYITRRKRLQVQLGRDPVEIAWELVYLQDRSLQAVAHRLGVSRTTVHRWLRQRERELAELSPMSRQAAGANGAAHHLPSPWSAAATPSAAVERPPTPVPPPAAGGAPSRS